MNTCIQYQGLATFYSLDKKVGVKSRTPNISDQSDILLQLYVLQANNKSYRVRRVLSMRLL